MLCATPGLTSSSVKTVVMPSLPTTSAISACWAGDGSWAGSMPEIGTIVRW